MKPRGPHEKGTTMLTIWSGHRPYQVGFVPGSGTPVTTFIKRAALILCAPLLLAACGKPGHVDDSARVFSGSVENYQEGPGVLTAITSLAEEAAAFGSGAIDANGNFSFTLPHGEDLDPGVLQPFTSVFCEGMTISDASARGVSVSFLMVTRDDSFVGLLFQATSEDVVNSFNPPDGEVLAFRLYADRNVSMTGSCRDAPLTFDIHLRRGWNIVLFETRLEPFGRDFRTAPLPAAMRWYFTSWPAIP